MNTQHRLKPFLITLLLCCANQLSQPLSAADPEPAAKPPPWHVKDADLRAPVKVDVKGALQRMPPQVYLADLPPLETTYGLAFDPLSKKVMQTDVRDLKEKAAMIAKLKQAKLKPQQFLSVAAWEAYVQKSANAYGGLTENDGGPMLRAARLTFCDPCVRAWLACCCAMMAHVRVCCGGSASTVGGGWLNDASGRYVFCVSLSSTFHPHASRCPAPPLVLCGFLRR